MNEMTKGKVIKTNFHEAQLLTAEDLRNEQEYHAYMRRVQNMAFHNPGIIRGVELTADGVDGLSGWCNLSSGVVLIPGVTAYDELISYEAYLREDLRFTFVFSPGENNTYRVDMSAAPLNPPVDTDGIVFHSDHKSFYVDENPAIDVTPETVEGRELLRFYLVVDYYDSYSYYSRPALEFSKKFSTTRNLYQLELPYLKIVTVLDGQSSREDDSLRYIILGEVQYNLTTPGIAVDSDFREYSGIALDKVTLDRLNINGEDNYIYGMKGLDESDNSMGIAGNTIRIEPQNSEVEKGEDGSSIIGGEAIPLLDMTANLRVTRDLHVDGDFIVEGKYITSSNALLGQHVLIEDNVLTLKLNTTTGADTADRTGGFEIFRAEESPKPAILWKVSPEQSGGAWVVHDLTPGQPDLKLAYGLEALMGGNNADILHGHSALARFDGTNLRKVVKAYDEGYVIIDPSGSQGEVADREAEEVLFINGNLKFNEPGLGIYFNNDPSGLKMTTPIKPRLASYTYVIVPVGEPAADMAQIQEILSAHPQGGFSLFIADGTLAISTSGIPLSGISNVKISGGDKLLVDVFHTSTPNPLSDEDDVYIFKLSGICDNIELDNITIKAQGSGLVRVEAGSVISNLRIHDCNNDFGGSQGIETLSLISADSCSMSGLEIRNNYWKRDVSNESSSLFLNHVELKNVTVSDNHFFSNGISNPDVIYIMFEGQSENLRITKNKAEGFNRYCVLRPRDGSLQPGSTTPAHTLRNLVVEDNRFYLPQIHISSSVESAFLSIKGGAQAQYFQVRITGNVLRSTRTLNNSIMAVLVDMENIFSGVMTNNDLFLEQVDYPVNGTNIHKMIITKNRIFGTDHQMSVIPMEDNIVFDERSL